MAPGFFRGFNDDDRESRNEMPAGPGAELWRDSIRESPTWGDMDDRQQEELRDRYIDSLYIGDLNDLIGLLNDLDIHWDREDWDDWRSAYDDLH